jgi:glucosyl-3-phosphoglycerate synthase
MSDISQHGLISTLQRLNENPALDSELAEIGKQRPIALVLPCHADELKRPALEGILQQISTAKFVAQVVIPINGLDSEGHDRARAYFADRLALNHRILWADPITAFIPEFKPGKGSNVWLAVGSLAKDRTCSVILTADADVTTFRLEMLARLAFAVASPEMGYTFAKSYYPRVTDRIYGRVSRLFFAPLLQAIVRTTGHHPLLDFLRSFRYPLAGECALTLDLAKSLPFETGWGLEVGTLCEVFRRMDPRQICQVDVGGRYDHKHQALGNGETGLVKMCREIAITLFGHLAIEGILIDTGFIQAVGSSYRREAAEAVRRSAALARINALQYALEEEQKAVELFADALRGVSAAAPESTLPAWSHSEPLVSAIFHGTSAPTGE